MEEDQSSSALNPLEQRCPDCGSSDVARSHRRGATETLLLRLLARVPLRCLACKTRFVAPAAAVRRHGAVHVAAFALPGGVRLQRALVEVAVVAAFVLLALYLLAYLRALLY